MEILIQNQVADGVIVPENPPRFDLMWVLFYESDEIISGYTPDIEPSISDTLKERPNPEKLAIIGRNVLGNYELVLARVKYDLIKEFGYIGQQVLSEGSKQTIVGMWIKLIDDDLIEIYRTGRIECRKQQPC